MPNARSPKHVQHVTPRQREILDLAVQGLTDKETAARLGIAVSTVRSHLERLYRENRFRNKTEAVAAWQHYREAEHPGKRPVQ
jgi:DNA-binding CsgD family transcriptional regulator